MRSLTFLLLFLTSMTLSADWLPREIHEVRAYIYDYTQDGEYISLLIAGRLHKGIINKDGAKLSEEQTQRLLKALETGKEPVAQAGCYMPHHGFVFFDKDGKAMGHIELCFHCGNSASSPKGIPNQYWDWVIIRKLLEELKIPILKEDSDYTKLFKEKKN